MRFNTVIFICIIALIPISTHAETLNAGFVQGIWYSTTSVFADIPVRMYVALRNNTDTDLTGTIRFTDNGTRIGTSYVSALPGRLVEGWTDWTPAYGEHSISATLSEVKLHVIGGQAEQVTVESTVAEDTITVDLDTDKDGIGNTNDDDDDNDGVIDIEEQALRTNPLIPNQKKKDVSDTQQSTSTETESVHVQNIVTNTSSNPDAVEGLEQFIPQEPINSLLGNVTEKVVTAKQSLDSYRATRADELKPYFSLRGEVTHSTDEAIDSEGLSASSSAEATITRSFIKEKTPFWRSVLDGGKALVSGFYTFILWITSNTLAYPALLELALLVGILYFFYRTARSLGSRQKK